MFCIEIKLIAASCRWIEWPWLQLYVIWRRSSDRRCH